jgi:hypothetical protein
VTCHLGYVKLHPSDCLNLYSFVNYFTTVCFLMRKKAEFWMFNLQFLQCIFILYRLTQHFVNTVCVFVVFMYGLFQPLFGYDQVEITSVYQKK